MRRPAKWISPPVERKQTGQQIEDRALAGAIRADQRENFSGAQVEGDVLHGGEAAEILGDVLRRKESLAARRQLPARKRLSLARARAAAGRVGSQREMNDISPPPAFCSITTTRMPKTATS